MMMRLFFAISCLFIGALKAESYASPSYSLSLPEDLKFLSPMTTKPTMDAEKISFIATVYEASSGLQNLLYTTFRLQIKEDGKTDVNVVAGQAASKLGPRSGFSKLIFKGENSLVFLYKEDELKKDFTHVLYCVPGGEGELIITSGSEYAKCFVKMEKGKEL